MTKQGSYFACEVCESKAKPLKVKKEGPARRNIPDAPQEEDEDDAKEFTKLVWPPSTQNGQMRNAVSLRAQSDAAKANPNLDPKDNFGVKGFYCLVLL